MSQELLPDSLWQEVQPLLPPHPDHPKGGNAFKDDRQCLRAILFVHKTGCGWQDIPSATYGVSGSTCWRRFHAWTQAGVWPALHQCMLDHLGKIGEVDQSSGMIDSASVRALKGGRTPGRTPRIGPKKAVNATSSAMSKARRWS